MKLFYQLFFLLTIVSVVSVLALSITHYYSSRELITQQVFDEVTAITLAKQDQVEQFIALSYDYANLLASTQLIIDSLEEKRNGTVNTHSHFMVETVLQKIIVSNSYFSEIVVVDLFGKVYVRTASHKDQSEDFSTTDYFISGRRGNYISEIFGGSLEDNFFVVSSPVKNTDKEVIGLIMVFISVDSLNNIIELPHTNISYRGLFQESLDSSFNSQNHVFITNRYGAVIASSDSLIDTRDASKSPSYFGCQQGSSYTGSYVSFGSKPVIGASTLISHPWWCVVTEFDEGTALRSISSLRNKTVGVLILSILAIGFLSFLVSRRVLKPVLILHDGMFQLKEGAKGLQIGSSGTNDEIGDLIDGFNSMSVGLLRSRKKLLQSLQKLKELDVAKTDFLNIISHELKTPITPIEANLDLLLDLDVGKLNKKQKEILEVIRRNAQKLKSIIFSCLKISRIEAGTVKLELGKVNLNALAKEIHQDMASEAERKGLVLKIKCNKLPVILADSDKIKECIANYVANAIKYSEKGEIIIETYRGKGFIGLCVIDTGIGIAQKDVKHIFQKFYQAGGYMAEKRQGVGLGLYSVKKYIELHRGLVGFSSTFGKGSRFWFQIPTAGGLK